MSIDSNSYYDKIDYVMFLSSIALLVLAGVGMANCHLEVKVSENKVSSESINLDETKIPRDYEPPSVMTVQNSKAEPEKYVVVSDNSSYCQPVNGYYACWCFPRIGDNEGCQSYGDIVESMMYTGQKPPVGYTLNPPRSLYPGL